MMISGSDDGATWSDEKRLTMARIFFDIFRGRSAAEISSLTGKAGIRRSEPTVRRDKEECMRSENPLPPSMASCRAYMAVLRRPDGIDIDAPGAFSELFDLADQVSREHQAQFGVHIYRTEKMTDLPEYWGKLEARIGEEEWLSVIDIIEIKLDARKPDRATEQVRHYLLYYLGIAYNYLGKAAESLRRFEQALEAAKAYPEATDLQVDVLLMCGLKAADCGQVDKAEAYLREAMTVIDYKPTSVVNALVLASKLRDKVFGLVVGMIAETLRRTNQPLDWAAIRRLILEDSELSPRKNDAIFLEVISALDERIRKGS